MFAGADAADRQQQRRPRAAPRAAPSPRPAGSSRRETASGRVAPAASAANASVAVNTPGRQIMLQPHGLAHHLGIEVGRHDQPAAGRMHLADLPRRRAPCRRRPARRETPPRSLDALAAAAANSAAPRSVSSRSSTRAWPIGRACAGCRPRRIATSGQAASAAVNCAAAFMRCLSSVCAIAHRPRHVASDPTLRTAHAERLQRQFIALRERRRADHDHRLGQRAQLPANAVPRRSPDPRDSSACAAAAGDRTATACAR